MYFYNFSQETIAKEEKANYTIITIVFLNFLEVKVTLSKLNIR